MYFYITMVEMQSIKQYNTLCRNLCEFPTLRKNLYVQHKKYL